MPLERWTETVMLPVVEDVSFFQMSSGIVGSEYWEGGGTVPHDSYSKVGLSAWT